MILSIVVPTYQEFDNLRLLAEKICHSLTGESYRGAFEIIIVDDNSSDGSVELVKELANEGQPIRIIERVDERGLSSAVIRGFLEARGDVILCMDADLSHPAEAIPAMVEALDSNTCDFVIGSRYVKGGSTEEGWGLFRLLNSKVATLLARPFTPAKDPMAGFFALKKQTFDNASELSPIGYKIGLELIVKCNCNNVVEIPIHFSDRQFGESKLSFKEQVLYIKHVKRLADYKYRSFSRFCQFCMVGASGMVWDLAIYASLMALSVDIYFARAIAILCAITWNFALNRRVTFSYSRIHNAGKQYICFLGSSSLGAIISYSISVGLLEYVNFFREGNHYIFTAICGIVIGTFLNFAMSHKIIFKK